MKNLILIIGVFSILLFGCKEDFEDLEFENWKPITAIPLVSAEISVDDVLTEFNHPEEVLILENGLIALNYKGELFSFSAESIIAVPNQVFSESLALGTTEAMILDNTGTVTPPAFNYPVNLALSPSDIMVSEIEFLSGDLEISLTREQDEGVSVTISINELVDGDGQVASFDFSGSGAVGIAETVSVDLTGYTLNPLMDFSNQINLSASTTFTNNEMNTAMAGDFISLDMEFSNLQFEYIIGDFGNLSISAATDSIEVNLFQNIQGGTFALSEAIFDLTVTNSFGFPADIELGEVVSVNENTGVETPLLLEDISLQGQEDLGGDPEIGVFSFNNDNSNVTSLFEPAPLLVVFNTTAEANPDGPPPLDDLNFITNESGFDVNIDLILPLEGYAMNVLVSDTVALSISFEQYEEIDSIEFKLQMDNGFPADISFQALFLDSNMVVTDSLFIDQTLIMESALTDADGNVTSPSNTINFILLEGDRAENIKNTDLVLFTAVFNTPGSENQEIIRIRETHGVDIKLGAKIFGNIEL